MKSISRRRLITSAFPAIFFSNNPSKADLNFLIGLLLSNSGQYHKVSKMLEKGIKRALDELNTENILFKKKIYIIKEEYNGDPLLIKQIQESVTIPVMAKCRIGHFSEAIAIHILTRKKDKKSINIYFLAHTISANTYLNKLDSILTKFKSIPRPLKIKNFLEIRLYQIKDILDYINKQLNNIPQ